MKMATKMVAKEYWKEIWGRNEIAKQIGTLAEENVIIEVTPLVSSEIPHITGRIEPGVLVRYKKRNVMYG